MKLLYTFILIVILAWISTGLMYYICQSPKSIPKKDTVKRDIHWETDTNGKISIDTAGVLVIYEISSKPVDSLIHLIDSLRNKIKHLKIPDTVYGYQVIVVPDLEVRKEVVDSLIKVMDKSDSSKRVL